MSWRDVGLGVLVGLSGVPFIWKLSGRGWPRRRWGVYRSVGLYGRLVSRHWFEAQASAEALIQDQLGRVEREREGGREDGPLRRDHYVARSS